VQAMDSLASAFDHATACSGIRSTHSTIGVVN
jgi:hypothetical protein